MPDQENEVEMHDYPLRWRVKSRSTPGETHMVDLGANDCIGMCTCKWATRTMVTDIREHRVPIRTCQHIIKAEIAFKKWAKKKFRDLDPNPDDEPPAF